MRPVRRNFSGLRPMSELTQSLNLPLVIVPRRYVDGRGWFSESYNEKRIRDLGINCGFVQDNRSSSKQTGTVRGFHFQHPPAAQAKLVSVLHGRILDIAVDIRQGSPSFGKHVSIELSVEAGNQIFIPEGFAHGFISLVDDVHVMYKTSAYYAPLHEGGICWNDPEIAFPWPFDKIIKSDKDGRLPALKDLESPFRYDGQPLVDLAVANLG
jgi:dTDP-4-dehydrorhamnose 3,5-epimerase